MNARRQHPFLPATEIGLALPARSRNDAASFVQSAKSHRAMSDRNAAIIRVRNSRQALPENSGFRVLMGCALLNNVEPGPAETKPQDAMGPRYAWHGAAAAREGGALPMARRAR